jgi:hypothetical protein
MKKATVTHSILCGALLASSATPGTAASGGDGWTWTAAPYIWATSIKADFDDSAPVSDPSPDFSDIVDKIDGAFLGHLEGQGDQWGILSDLIFLSLADDRSRPNFSIDADLDTTIFELAAVWSPGATRYQGFEAIVGLRYMDVELGLTADPDTPALSGRSTGFDKGYTDALVGARYSLQLADKWALGFRGDVSFGDSEGSWSANVMFRRELGSGALLLGYRYFDVELEPGADSFDLTLYGPEIGYAFVW